jgi:hypothetical protein
MKQYYINIKTEIPGVIPEFNRLNLYISNEYFASHDELKKLFSKLLQMKESLYNIGGKDGFIVTRDFTNDDFFPVVSGLTNAMLDKDAINKDLNKEVNGEIKERVDSKESLGSKDYFKQYSEVFLTNNNDKGFYYS